MQRLGSVFKKKKLETVPGTWCKVLSSTPFSKMQFTLNIWLCFVLFDEVPGIFFPVVLFWFSFWSLSCD